jgi:FkbM family methyltransferase
MEEAIIEQQLDRLLGESPEIARQRAASAVGEEDAPLALYGAGNLGRTVLASLRQAGVAPQAFADDTPAKQGQTIDGLPVMRPAEVIRKFGPQTVFVITIFNPQSSFIRVAQRLRQETGARVVSFLNLAWKYPEQFLPHYYFELPDQLLVKSADIRRAFEVFADDESRRQFVAQLRFRLWLDFDALPASNKGDYFPADVFAPLPPDTIFVDCGAYDGDTVRSFLAHQRSQFKSIYAFEPDAANFQRLVDFVGTLGAETQSKILLFNAGAGARRTRLRFNATGGMGAAFDSQGDVEVDVLPIAEVVSDDGGAIYLKFDVEGGEWAALEGAEKLIQRARPLLAVSVYHQPDDLWQLPLHLQAFNSDYRLFLRTQGEDGMDVICYAVPPERLPGGSRHQS